MEFRDDYPAQTRRTTRRRHRPRDRRKPIVGAVVLVAENGAPAYRRVAGFADREEGRAMREVDVFRLASVTKPFVAATAMRLVEQGAIALDDPVTRFLPEFRPRLPPGEAPPLTLHHLLTHTSGLGYWFQEDADGPHHRLGVSDGLEQPGLAIEENLRRLAWRLDRSAPRPFLGVVDLAQMKNVLLNPPPGGDALVLDDAEVATPLAVFVANLDAQKHGGAA